jgi:hypothetical protein
MAQYLGIIAFLFDLDMACSVGVELTGAYIKVNSLYKKVYQQFQEVAVCASKKIYFWIHTSI